MADVVVLIRQRLFTTSDLPPALAIVLAAIKVQRKRYGDRDLVVHVQRIELRVHVQREHDLVVVVEGLDARDAVVFGAVDVVDLEPRLEEDVFRHLDRVCVSSRPGKVRESCSRRVERE